MVGKGLGDGQSGGKATQGIQYFCGAMADGSEREKHAEEADILAVHAVHTESDGAGACGGRRRVDGMCADELHVEAAVVDGVGDGGEEGHALDAEGGGVGEETDDDVGHAGETGEHVGDGGDTGGAGHAADGEGDPVGTRHRGWAILACPPG